MLKQHPGTDLRSPKEIQYFSSSANLRKGKEWYYQHFQGLDSTRVKGEASTDYFFDYVLIDNLIRDDQFPLIPELVKQELPDARIIIMLRDPVQRAISAYYHHLQGRQFQPGTGVFEAVEQYPHLRILTRGYYQQYLKTWLGSFPENQLMCLIFERDVVEFPQKTLKKVYAFLGLDQDFLPNNIHQLKRKRWGWTHIWLNFHLGSWYGFIYRQLRKTFLATLLDGIDKLNIIPPYTIPDSDLKVLIDIYQPVRIELEELLNVQLSEWRYDHD
jgi:hypothetical protein